MGDMSIWGVGAFNPEISKHILKGGLAWLIGARVIGCYWSIF